MDHPFEVGGTYRNRKGPYEVVELKGPKMVIRYQDGPRQETTVKLQARIWKHIQAEERIGSQVDRHPSDPSPKGGGGRTTRLERLVEQNLEHIFIAYAFPYVEEALNAVNNAPPSIEAVVGQPYNRSRIVSARKAMLHYRGLTDGQHIPILFTPQTRHQDQVFAYGSRLLDLCHEAEIEKIRRHVDAGKWLLWDDTLYANNFLIVKKPIRELAVKLPIAAATNLLPGATQGEPIAAVAIPAPKALDPAFHHLLDDL
ncbi:MAG: hypothetical protein ACOC6F_03370 [bacterium]